MESTAPCPSTEIETDAAGAARLPHALLPPIWMRAAQSSQREANNLSSHTGQTRPEVQHP